jgi:hypothetical protein
VERWSYRAKIGAEVERTSKNFAEAIFLLLSRFVSNALGSICYAGILHPLGIYSCSLILRGGSNFVRTACTRAAGPTGFLSCRAARNYACIRVMTWIEMAFLSTSPYDVEVTCKDSYLTLKKRKGRSSRLPMLATVDPKTDRSDPIESNTTPTA